MIVNKNIICKNITCNNAFDTATGGGQIYLNGEIGNIIEYNTNGVAPPSFDTRSTGTKIVLYPNITASATDHAIGVEYANTWYSIPNAASKFNWYGGTTLAASLTGAGLLTVKNLTCTGAVNSSSNTGGIGYVVGAGGSVTQLTSKATTVTLARMCGTITSNAASLASNTVVSFVFVNSVLAATDNLILNIVGGTNGAYCLGLDAVAAGSCTITLRNLSLTAIAEAVSIRFTILNSVNT